MIFKETCITLNKCVYWKDIINIRFIQKEGIVNVATNPKRDSLLP